VFDVLLAYVIIWLDFNIYLIERYLKVGSVWENTCNEKNPNDISPNFNFLDNRPNLKSPSLAILTLTTVTFLSYPSPDGHFGSDIQKKVGTISFVA